MITTVASGAEERGGGGEGGSSAAWPCSYFSSFQPFRSYFHDHRDAKICDARSQIEKNVCMHLAASQPLLVNPGFCAVHESAVLRRHVLRRPMLL